MALPLGVSLFIRSWRFVSASRDPRAAVNAYRSAGLRWGMPVVMRPNQARSAYIKKLREPAYWRAFREAGLPLWGCWLLPYPSSTLELEAQRLCEDMARLGAGGVIPDPELEFKGEEQAAADLNGAMVRHTERLGLGYAMTSYSLPQAHPNFPFSAFSDASGIAQTYDRDNEFVANYVDRALAGWRAKGFDEVMACRGLNDHGTNSTKTAADLRRHFALLPNPRRAGVWGPVTIPAHAWAELSAWANGVQGGPPAPSGGSRGGSRGPSAAAIGLGLVALGGAAIAMGTR